MIQPERACPEGHALVASRDADRAGRRWHRGLAGSIAFEIVGWIVVGALAWLSARLGTPGIAVFAVALVLGIILIARAGQRRGVPQASWCPTCSRTYDIDEATGDDRAGSP